MSCVAKHFVKCKSSKDQTRWSRMQDPHSLEIRENLEKRHYFFKSGKYKVANVTCIFKPHFKKYKLTHGNLPENPTKIGNFVSEKCWNTESIEMQPRLRAAECAKLPD